MWSALTLLLVITDQVTKSILIARHSHYISGNAGVAFSLGSPGYALAGLILLLIGFWSTKKRPLDLWLALLMAVSSNLFDRWRWGQIIDYLRLGSLHFNVTDCLIVGLVALIGFELLRR